MSGRKLARRACDGCKIRKVKCSEDSPCEGCRNANIPCTWLKQVQPRGPRRLRDATLAEIRKAQDILQTQSKEGARKGLTKSPNVTDPDPPPTPSSEVAQLVLYLCVYRVQLYPIWPVIKVERLIASLQSQQPDLEVWALGYALAAATASRTQSIDLGIAKRNHAQIMEAKCQVARAKVPSGRPPNLTTVRIAFFLHVYYESLEANSMKSMLYLREAVTIATMIGLHKENYYTEVPPQEREIRRRVLWLLFVTERVISVLYEQPITLRTKIQLPSTSDTDELDILAGFQLVVKLFSRLEESGFFSALEDLEAQGSPLSTGRSSKSNYTPDFIMQIQADVAHRGYISSVQELDLAVTQCWLLVMNMRLQQAGVIAEGALKALLLATQNTIDVVQKSSRTLIEAHGFALQLKVSTIIGVFHELSSPRDRNFAQPITHDRCKDLSTGLASVFAVKSAQEDSNSGHSTYLPSKRSTTLRSSSLSSSQTGRLTRHAEQFSWTPSSNGLLSSHRVLSADTVNHESPQREGSQNFARDHNYEGLFDAVELAGVQSSDSVENLFSQSHLEHYSTFDDEWPDAHPPLATHNTHQWQNGLFEYA